MQIQVYMNSRSYVLNHLQSFTKFIKLLHCPGQEKKKTISKIIFECLAYFLGTNEVPYVPLKTIGEILCRREIRVTVNMTTLKCGFSGCRNSCNQWVMMMMKLYIWPSTELMVSSYLEAPHSEENCAFLKSLSQSGFAAWRSSGCWQSHKGSFYTCLCHLGANKRKEMQMLKAQVSWRIISIVLLYF